MVQKVQFSLKKTKYSLLLFICNRMNRLTENTSFINPLLAWLSWAFNTSDWTQVENLHAVSHFKSQHKTFSALNHRPTSELFETSQISVFNFSISYSLLFSTVACNATSQIKGHASLTHPFLVMWVCATCESVRRKFVWALRTTTANSRASFIYFYLVFPINFRIVFLPPTYTLILLDW